MDRHRRVRRSTVVTAIGAALAVSIFVPSLAAGDAVGDLLGGGGNAVDNTVKGVTDTVNGATAGSGLRAGTPPDYQPPLHGTNPHGQGSVATVDILPSNSNPYPANPEDAGPYPENGEEVIIGDSRGEQQPDGSYHGRVTLLYLFGFPIVQVESGPGESNGGPVPPAVLGTVCTGTAGNVCLGLLEMNSSTSGTGSNNSFTAVRASLVNGAIAANVAQSSGNINESGGCQTANGSSSLTNGNVGPLGFNLLSSSSSSTACNDGTQTTSNSSTLGTPLGDVLEIIAPGCGTGTPNTSFTALSPLLALVCHANDEDGGQTGSPYGVREALTGFVGILDDTALVKGVLSGSESHAVAPPVPQVAATPPAAPAPGAPAGQQGRGQDGEAGAVEEGGPAASEAGPGDDGALPFTGQNLLLLGLIGAGLLGLGLLGTAARQRSTV